MQSHGHRRRNPTCQPVRYAAVCCLIIKVYYLKARLVIKTHLWWSLCNRKSSCYVKLAWNSWYPVTHAIKADGGLNSQGFSLITVQQDVTYSVYYISIGSSTCFGCWQLFHNKWILTVRYMWISSISTRADGSRSGYVETILLISIVLFPKYFITTKSGIHTTVLTDFVYCIFPTEFQHNLNYIYIYIYFVIYFIFCCTYLKILLLTIHHYFTYNIRQG